MTYSQEQYDALLAVCRSYRQDTERLEAENARLTEKLKQVLLAVDTVKEMNAMCNIDEQNAEIERLKDDYAKLQEQFAKYQTASDKEILAQVKQAKIEVLNKLRERVETAIDSYFNLDGGGYYLAEGAMNDIDELIREVEK